MIYEILKRYREHFDMPDTEPLDGDETTKLSKILLNEIDIVEGNQTHDLYERRLKRLEYPSGLFSEKTEKEK